jgi:hypothetical protein
MIRFSQQRVKFAWSEVARTYRDIRAPNSNATGAADFDPAEIRVGRVQEQIRIAANRR